MFAQTEKNERKNEKQKTLNERMNRRIKYLTWANARKEKEETTHRRIYMLKIVAILALTHTHSATRATRITMTTMTKTTTTATIVILIMLNLYSRRKTEKKTFKRITNKNSETIGKTNEKNNNVKSEFRLVELWISNYVDESCCVCRLNGVRIE